jgi:L-ascorbate metabolism protein UlaG (beta-lactamase superfamily)
MTMAAVPLTWLGHAAFRLDSPGGKRIYVDPFLSGNPKCPDAEKDPERIDLIAVTHGHGDHVGDTVELAKRFGCPVVALVELRGWLGAQGVPEHPTIAEGPNKGGTVEVDGVKLTLTDANHSSSGPDGSYLGEPAGIVLELEDGFTIYFAGDTNVFASMQLIGRIYEPDVAVLPIGDHYTMAPREAAVALELLGVKRCVPCHYGTFPLLRGTPDELRRTRVPEIAVEGELELPADVLWADDATDTEIKAAHAAGRPVIAHAATAADVKAALGRPEVACVLVPPDQRELLALDLRELTYG